MSTVRSRPGLTILWYPNHSANGRSCGHTTTST